MAQFRTKPVTIEAIQYLGVQGQCEQAFDHWAQEHKGHCQFNYEGQRFIIINSYDHKSVAKPGDYIIAGGDGSMHVMSERDFLKLYDPMSEVAASPS